MNFYGSTLASFPVLRAGFNNRLAFVQTNNAPDLEDVYRLQLDPAAADHYLFEGRRYPLERRVVSIEVKAESGEIRKDTRMYWSSHLGPVVHRAGFRLRPRLLPAGRVAIFRRISSGCARSHAARVS